MWLRFKSLRNFNKFFILMQILVTLIVILEIVTKISGGVEITGKDYQDYAAFWASFLLAYAFVNFVDCIIRAIDGFRAKS